MKKITLPRMIPPVVNSGAGDRGPMEPLDDHFNYTGLGAAAYKHFTKESRYVAMTDGTKLAVDIFLPADGPKTPGPFPTLFVFTPYSRSYLHSKLAWYEKLMARITRGSWGPIFDWSVRVDVNLFLSRGYAFVIADMRGTGASFGWQVPFTPAVADDAKELLEWIAEQPWSNGKVGMMGRSYLGWIQLMVAAKKPKPLVCIMPEVICSDAFSEAIRPGGIGTTAWIERYSQLLQDLNSNRLDPKNLSLPATPVVDEDGDDDLTDEIPIMDDDGLFLDNGPPVYSDGKKREGLYYQATLEHKKNVPFSMFVRKDAPFFDTEVIGDIRFIDGSPGYYLNEIINSGIPVYHVGGWLDGFTKGTTQLFASMQGKTKSYLSVSPRCHYPPFINKQYKKFLGYDGNYETQLAIEQLRFFDYYLKGIENGFEKGAPVHIYVMNKGWRACNEWPLTRQKMTSFYCAQGRALSTQMGSDGSDDYKVDFSVSSNYGKNGVNRWLRMYVPDGLMIRTGIDKKCLTYDTEPLSADTEVTGHPLVNIWVSSNRDDGDFFVYLEDVDKTGRALYVTEGELRAGWKNIHPKDDQVLGKTEILPDLPWHGYKKSQYTMRPLAGGEPVELCFDLLPTSWLFKKGHRIRISIACADKGNFEMNPFLCSGDDSADCPETLVTLHRTAAMPSRVELPVIP